VNLLLIDLRVMAKRILITGASGLLGTRLTQILHERGYEVLHLSRSREHTTVKTYLWNIWKQTIESEAITDTDAIIHLAGASVAEGRWTPARKKEIIDSRIDSTALLFDALTKHPNRVKVFLSASAIGYYGFNKSQVFNEDDEPGKDFLAQVTTQWEQAVKKIETPAIRVVRIRIGVVLSAKGGALKPIAKTAKAFIGSPLGSGNQYVSWVHIDDVCNAFIHALEREELSGAYNAVAPGFVTNRDLTKAVISVLHKPMIFPAVPAFVLKLMFGEMAEIVLNGSKVSSEKILATGFTFKYPSLKPALENLLR
jgi:uncharacterized protein (TIGR01777 family)